jgi:hypothetical protein
MNERLPYELQLQQQWINLPLPDENMAWADMRHRLEEEDDRPVIAWWRKGCAVWGTLLLLLLATGWWVFRPERWFIGETNMQQQKGNTPSSGKRTTDGNGVPGKNNNAPVNGKGATAGNNTVSGRSTITTTEGGRKTKPAAGTTGSSKPKPVTDQTSSSIVSGDGGKPGRNRQPVNNSTQPQQPVSNASQKPVIDQPVPPADSISNSKKNNIPTPDSVIAKIDSVKKKDTVANKPTVASVPKTDSSKKRKIFYSAGIAGHQQIPLGGQKFTPYSSSGRKSSLADYIPSVYFRVNKENKWFIQGEFRYGAPQYTKEFLYKNQTKNDTINQTPYSVTTTAKLKKTFYHQLPVTFNYYVLPNWSLGAGLAWNKFSSAVSDQSIIGVNSNTLADTVLPGTGIVKIKKDSVFPNSYFQAVFETHYSWKRFSFGARYMFGLQPYIKFTLPNGGQQQEKNSSLQLFIRYELWRSGKR